MDKLTLPTMGEETWFTTLNNAFKTLDGRWQSDDFNRNYVLTDGLTRANDPAGDLGIQHFQLGDLNIVFGWGSVHFEAKAYQSGYIVLPYSGSSWRCIVGDAFSWDGEMKFTSSDEGKIMITPKTDVNGTYSIHFIMMWSTK